MKGGHLFRGRAAAVRTSAALSIVSGLMATALAMSGAHAAGPTSSFYFESEAGDTVARGASGYITSDDAAFMAYGGGPELPSVNIDVTDWVIGAAGPGGAPLVPGTTYSDARGPSHPTAPRLAISSQALYSGCSELTGGFTVHDVGYFGSRFSRLSMSFHLTCDGAAGALYGEVRFNTSTPAISGVTHAPPSGPVTFAATPVGSTSASQDVTLRNIGGSSIAIGRASLGGSDPGRFRIVDDGCSSSALPAGSSCSLGVRFAPTLPGEANAWVSIPVATRSGERRLSLRGTGQRVTTITIQGPAGWQTGPVELRARVEPSPIEQDGQGSIWFVYPDPDPQKGPVGGPEPMLADGTARWYGDIPPGIHRVYAEFRGGDEWAPSRSQTIEISVVQPTSIGLTSTPNPATSDETVVVTAKLYPADVTYAGGDLTLTDLSTGSTLARLAVGPGRSAIRIEPFLTAGEHRLRAEFTAYEGVLGSSSELVQVVRVNAGATIPAGRLYPVVDGYRDQLRVEGWRYSPFEVSLQATPVGSTTPVRTDTLTSDAQDFLWTWDGTDDAGALVPAGDYDVTVTFSDGGDAPLVVRRRIPVSLDRVEWRTRTITLAGRAYSLVSRSNGGSISPSASNYAGGVRLASNRGSAAVSYAFRVPSADVIGPLTFAVEGRSTNGHRAVIAIWDPSEGGYRQLASYNGARLVGPGFRWWPTVVDGDERVRDGKVRALVLVARGVGGSGPATFDVRQVRVTIRVGAFVHATSANATAGPRDDVPTATPSAGTDRAISDIPGARSLLVPRLRPVVPWSAEADVSDVPDAAAPDSPPPSVDPGAPTIEPSPSPDPSPAPDETGRGSSTGPTPVPDPTAEVDPPPSPDPGGADPGPDSTPLPDGPGEGGG